METLVHAGLANAILAAGLAVLAAVASWVVRRAALAHALWLLVLLKLVTPPLMQVPVLRGPGFVEAAAASGNGDERSAEVVDGRVLGAESSVLGTPAPVGNLSPVGPQLSFPQDPPLSPCESATEYAADGEAASDILPAAAWELPVGIAWLSGSLVWWGLAVVRLRRLHRLLRHARPAPADVQAQACRIADRLGLRRCPTISMLRDPISPLLWAVLGSPRLLLPAKLWERLSDEQRDTLLAHELAHLRRGDPWVRRLELVVLGLYWWHPVAWWARRRLQEAEEQCCDAWVVWAFPQSARAYALALVETIAFLSRSRTAVPVGVSGAGHVPLLKRRLTMILKGNSPRRLSWAGLLAVVALAGLLPLLPTWAPPVHAEPPDKPLQPADADRPPEKVDPLVRPAPAADELQKLREEVARLRDRYERSRAELEQKEQALRKPVRLLASLANDTDRPVRISGVRSSCAAVSAKAQKLELAPGEATYVEITVDPRRFAGSETALVYVALDQPEPRGSYVIRYMIRAGGNVQATVTPGHAALSRGPADGQPRMQEMEKRLDALQREIESLRRELRSQRPEPGARSPVARDLIAVNQHEITIPFQVEEAMRTKISSVILTVSTDEGLSWRVVAEAPPDQKRFSFRAPADGLYWFQVGTIAPGGGRSLNEIAGRDAPLKVLVLTSPPQVSLTSELAGPNAVLRWVVNGSHVDLQTLRVEQRPKGDALVPWRAIPVEKVAQGTVFIDNQGKPLDVRVSVSDVAGNIGVSEMVVK